MAEVEAAATIDSLLRGSGIPRQEADLLLRTLLGCERGHLLARGEEEVDPQRARAAKAWFARRRAGEPVAYITGQREFYGLELCVTRDVLIPRPETEQLVDLALEWLPGSSARSVLDLGTGSGAIALALADSRLGLELVATDISEAALAVARRNAREYGAEVDLVRSDWFAGLGAQRFDLIASNPPYVAPGDPHLDQGDLPYEPRLALVGGGDGLDCIREIATGARSHLRPGGRLLLEHGHDQGGVCIELLRRLGYVEVVGFADLAGLPRVCAGTWLG